jgi:hypothetical protein
MSGGNSALLEIVENLSYHHREHEKYYADAPLRDALALQQVSRTLEALAERWATTEPAEAAAPSPYAGAADLNDQRAIETSGVLFLESGEPPAEMERIRRELATMAEDAARTGEWLATAMETSWSTARALLQVPELVDLLADRHHIIANDWQNAGMLGLISRQLRRALDLLDCVDFHVAALRADLAGERRAPGYLFAAADLIDQAADLAAVSATLVHQNERRWRVFHGRVTQIANG